MRRAQASLLGGLFIGILSVLPILNVCCCLWVVVGGVLTTYLLQQGRPMAVEGSEAALAGLIAGVVGALISVVFLFVVHAVSGGAMEAQFRDMVEQFPQISPEARDQGLALISGPGFVLLSALVTIPAYAVIGMLGALLGRVFFRKPPPPIAQT